MAVMHPIGARLTVLVAAVLVGSLAEAGGSAGNRAFPIGRRQRAGTAADRARRPPVSPDGEGPFPALVGLPGCSGMMRRNTSKLTPLYRAWGAELSRRGYVVLLVDSLGPRRHGEMCSIRGFDPTLYRKRPHDAYGAFLFLQQLPFVRGDRIGLLGWSQGGGVTLYAIGSQHLGRPAPVPDQRFPRRRGVLSRRLQ